MDVSLELELLYKTLYLTRPKDTTMSKEIKQLPLDEDISIRKADTFGNHELYRPSGGRLPKELCGIYTSPSIATRRLEAYLETLGVTNEKKKIKEEIKSINKLDHMYDEV